MNAASLLLEVLNVPVAVTAASAQIPAQPLQAFKDSLVVACQASLDANTTNQTPTDAVLVKPPVNKPAVADPPSQVVPQPVSAPGSAPVPLVQQPSLLQTVLAQVKTFQGAQTVPALPPAALLAATKPTVGRTPVTSPRSRPVSHLLLTPAVPVPPSLPNQAIAVVTVPQNETAVALPVPTFSALVKVAGNTPVTPASSSVNVVPISIPDTAVASPVKAVPIPAHATAASPAGNAVPIPIPDPVIKIAAGPAQPVLASKPSSPSAPASAPVDVVANPQPRAVAVIEPSAPVVKAPVADPLPIAAADVPLPSIPAPSIAPATVAKPIVGTVAKAVAEPIPQVAAAPVTNAAKDTTSPVALPADTSLPPAPAPAVHNAVTPREATSKTIPVPTVLVNPPAATPVPATAQLVASLPLPVVPVPATIPVVLAAKGNDLGVKAVSDAAGVKQHAPAVASQDASPAGSPATSQPGDQIQSQGQSQSGPQQTGQSTPTVAANFVNHPIAASTQNATVAVPLQNATPPTAAASHATKAPEAPAPTVSVLPQPVPVVNTARLIQTAGQSEMRVGMRSNDFGNISISTSTTRDSISAQISLDHSELAKTLATHVPEMQARLGGNQAMEVRIDMNGQSTGQGGGQGGANSSGMSNASGDGSRGDHPPRGNAGPAPQNETSSVTATAAIPLAEVAIHSRLDIRA